MLSSYTKKSLVISMKIIHLSNVVGQFGGGVAQVVEALFSIQTNLGYSPTLWFAGEKKQESEVLSGRVDDVCSVAAIEHSILGFPYFFGDVGQKKSKYCQKHKTWSAR